MSQDLFYFISNLAIVAINILRIEDTVKGDSLYLVLCVYIDATKDSYFKSRTKYLRIAWRGKGSKLKEGC